jgi:release factor glutamine methyltransferase
MNENTKIEAGLGIAEAMRSIAQKLSEKSIYQAEAEARVLVLAATSLSRTQLIAEPDHTICAEEAERLSAWLKRRLGGEPVTRITGRRNFWTLDLTVTPDVLDPRADTEVIVETALDLLGARKNDALRILDLGTGTGALLLALLAECPKATGIGVDLSSAACAVARDNAQKNGLSSRATIRQGNWDEGIDERFDLVLSNPPYIEKATIADLDPEVRNHDPILALDGGPDGLDAYRALVRALPRLLAPTGVCVLELGIGQSAQVTALAESKGLTAKALKRDLGGIERALALGWPC